MALLSALEAGNIRNVTLLVIHRIGDEVSRPVRALNVRDRCGGGQSRTIAGLVSSFVAIVANDGAVNARSGCQLRVVGGNIE